MNKLIRFFDATKDPCTVCLLCGRSFESRSRMWWDDFTCRDCHELFLEKNGIPASV
jgi:hypothetical protein